MGKGADVATAMSDIKNNIEGYALVFMGAKERVNLILTMVDGFTDTARFDAARLQGLSQDMSDHMGMLAGIVDSDSATWAGWQQAQHEVDSGTLTAFAPLVTALEKVHGLLMAVNGAIDEAVQIAAGADQAAERAQLVTAALIPL